VPLKQWAEARARPDEPMDWYAWHVPSASSRLFLLANAQHVATVSACRGTTGQGATWPPSFWRGHAGTDKADTVLNYLVRVTLSYLVPSVIAANHSALAAQG
jgi:hypothetical protein